MGWLFYQSLSRQDNLVFSLHQKKCLHHSRHRFVQNSMLYILSWQYSDGFDASCIVFYLRHLSIGTDVHTGSRPTYTQHMLVCLCIFWFRVRLLWVLEIAMECSRHDGWNYPFRVHLTFSQTQMVEMVMWKVQYVKKQGFSLQFTQWKQEAADSLPALKPWRCLSIKLTHLQTSQSTETVQTCHVTSSANHVRLVAK